MNDDPLDQVRRILDKLAAETEPPCDHLTWVLAHQAAIDAISRIAYPEAIG